MMPGMNGVELCRKAATQATNSQRAWVGQVGINPITIGGKPGAAVIFQNFGKTPAKNVVFNNWLRVHENKEEIHDLIANAQREPQVYPIVFYPMGPVGPVMPFKLPYDPPDAEPDILEGKKMASLFGQVDYEDIFGFPPYLQILRLVQL